MFKGKLVAILLDTVGVLMGPRAYVSEVTPKPPLSNAKNVTEKLCKSSTLQAPSPKASEACTTFSTPCENADPLSVNEASTDVGIP